MNSSGDMTRWVVPSLYALFSCNTTSAQVLKLFALIGAPAYRRMKAEAVRDAVSARGCSQGQKRAIPIRFGEVGQSLLFDEKPLEWPRRQTFERRCLDRNSGRSSVMTV
jgi:hypothetical protein